MSGFLVFTIFVSVMKIEFRLNVNQSPDSYRGWFEPMACPDPYREGGAKSLTEMSGFLVFCILDKCIVYIFYFLQSWIAFTLVLLLILMKEWNFIKRGVAEGPL